MIAGSCRVLIGMVSALNSVRWHRLDAEL
jgi:hypothetical protein